MGKAKEKEYFCENCRENLWKLFTDKNYKTIYAKCVGCNEITSVSR